MTHDIAVGDCCNAHGSGLLPNSREVSLRMNKPRMCPSCSQSILPWRVWQISRWTSIPCPRCGTLLNRKFDVQECLLIGTALVLYFALDEFTEIPNIYLFLVVCCLLYVADVFTARLVPAQGSQSKRE
jgi:predicted RNA-binding Zn-ribbon protein involved in translation (DUF1610 family)